MCFFHSFCWYCYCLLVLLLFFPSKFNFFLLNSWKVFFSSSVWFWNAFSFYRRMDFVISTSSNRWEFVGRKSTEINQKKNYTIAIKTLTHRQTDTGHTSINIRSIQRKHKNKKKTKQQNLAPKKNNNTQRQQQHT